MSRRRVKHEDHINHEAWVIPYADLLTLLLAFFVVMYAMSSVNEGKYRIMAASLSAAFGGAPKAVMPIQKGETQIRGSDYDRPSPMPSGAPASPNSTLTLVQAIDRPLLHQAASAYAREQLARTQLTTLSTRIRHALDELVKQNRVTVRQTDEFIEVEIQSDILFASGAAVPSSIALDTAQRIGRILADEPNAIRVEGYTDNVPISTVQFASNWELSSARAAGIVHKLADTGVSPERLTIAAFGEYQPIRDNSTPSGRNANRRVMLVIMAYPGSATAEIQEARSHVSEDQITSPDESAEAVQLTEAAIGPGSNSAG